MSITSQDFSQSLYPIAHHSYSTFYSPRKRASKEFVRLRYLFRSDSLLQLKQTKNPCSAFILPASLRICLDPSCLKQKASAIRGFWLKSVRKLRANVSWRSTTSDWALFPFLVVRDDWKGQLPEACFWIVKKRMNSFWKRLFREYANSLINRTKWRHPADKIPINDIVWMPESFTPIGAWPLGRVIGIYTARRLCAW